MPRALSLPTSAAARAQEDRKRPVLEASAWIQEKSHDRSSLLTFVWGILADVLLAQLLLEATNVALTPLIATICFLVLPCLVLGLLIMAHAQWLLTVRGFWIKGPSSSLAAALPAPVNFLLRCVCCLMSCVMAAYLGLCHLVTATASVAVLDFMNLVSTARPGSDMYFLDDLAFMDAYKAARYTLQPLFHSLPQALMLTYMLATKWQQLGPGLAGCALHSILAHLVNLADKGRRAAGQWQRARAVGLTRWQHVRLVLQLRGGSRVHPSLRQALQERSFRHAGSQLVARPRWSLDSELDAYHSAGKFHLVPKFIRPVRGTHLGPLQLAAMYMPLLQGQRQREEAGEAVVRRWTVEGLGGGVGSEAVLGLLLATGLPCLPGLEELRVRESALGGGGMREVAAALAQHSKLAVLQLSHCQLDCQADAALAALVANKACHLRHLLLAHCTAEQAGSGAPGSAKQGAAAGAGATDQPVVIDILDAAAGAGADAAGAAAPQAAGPLCQLFSSLALSSRLARLELPGTVLGSAAVRQLAAALRSPCCPVRHLHVCLADLAAADVQSLSSSLVANTCLANLVVDHREMGAGASAALMGVLAAKAGGQLAKGARQPMALVHHPTWPGVVSLDALPLHFVSSSGSRSGSSRSSSSSSSSSGSRRWADSWADRLGILTDWRRQADTTATTTTTTNAASDGSLSASSSQGDLEAPQGSSAGGDVMRGDQGSSHGSVASSAGPDVPAHLSMSRHDSTQSLPARRGAALQQPSKGPPLGPCALRVFFLCPGSISDAIRDALRHMPAITSVSCRGQTVGDAGASTLAGLLASSVPLQELDLAGNAVGDEGAEALAGALASAGCSLLRLDLSRNALGDKGAEALCTALRTNTSLQQLSLRSNRYPLCRTVLRQLAALVAARPGLTIDLGTGATRRGSAELLLEGGSSSRLLPLAPATSAAAPEQDVSPDNSAALLLGPQAPPSAAPGGGDLAPPGPQAGSAVVQLSAAYLQQLGSSEAASGACHRRSPSGASSSSALSTSSADQCEICFDRAVAVQLRGCCHRLCVGCYRQVWELAAGQAGAGQRGSRPSKPPCPFCRVPISGFDYLAEWLEG